MKTWIAIALLALAGCKGLKRVGTVDEGHVLAQEKMHAETLDSLRARGLLDGGERVLAYYYRGLDGHVILLTDRKLSETVGGQTRAIPLDDLVALAHGDALVGKLTTARGRDGTQIQFVISGINGGPAFRDALDAEFAKRRR